MSYGLNQASTGMNPSTMNTGLIKNKVPKGYSEGKMQQFTPEQMQLFQQLFGQVGPESYLSKLAGGDQAAFNQIEAPALRQFNELQGGIASRFSGMGGLGARKSSGFQNTINSAASNFAEQLQAQRQSIQQQALKDLFGMSEHLLNQRPYEQFLIKKQNQNSGWGGGIGAALGGLGGFALGGPAGAFAGGQLGYGVGSQF